MDQLYLAALIIATVLICILAYKLVLGGKDNFASDDDKIRRANEVIQKTGAEFHRDPDMSFNKFKTLIDYGNAVEYRDMRNAADINNISAESLASRW